MIDLPYEIIRSRRRTAAVQIYPGGRIVVRVPVRFSSRQVDAVLERRAAWIERKYRELVTMAPESYHLGFQMPRRNGETLALLGDSFTVGIETGGRRHTVTPRWIDRHLVVRVRGGDGGSASESAVACAAERWYRATARAIFVRRLAEIVGRAVPAPNRPAPDLPAPDLPAPDSPASARGPNDTPPPIPDAPWPEPPDVSVLRLAEFGYSPVALPELSVRSMKRRWGSCSSRRTITLNTVLAARSPREIDYVLVHELCHFRQMNHSRRFYDLLEAIMPDWKERRRLLQRQ